jgi:Tol biopolymer transport system component
MQLLLPLLPLLFAAAEEPAEARYLSNTRQLIFEGTRSGEGYFSKDGRQLIFQSEREADNPFYQIYLLDLETGDSTRVSPGHGKTTCAWVHPTGKKVLFASTHEDPEARNKQKAELEFRASGQQKRYSWDYDENYDIFEAGTDGKNLKNLTKALGYDAEGSYSPDGKKIAFASNRAAYAGKPSAADVEKLKLDPSYFMDIYIMDADGKNLKQLTRMPGYDGGPFFSPDGKRITWRHFTEDGSQAEVWTMKVDGTDQKQLTRLGAMSWAPYYHPSGDYLVFATNLLGFANFEVYMVDAAGEKDPVRITSTDGFDGLPVFSPDGARLAWTSSRTANKKAQLFMADWNDAAARGALKAAPPAGTTTASSARAAPPAGGPTEARPGAKPEVAAADLDQHIRALTEDAMDGRMTGGPGEAKATQYVADVFAALGLVPAGDNGTFFQEFTFTAGVNPGAANKFSIQGAKDKKVVDLVLNKDWRPLGFSLVGPVAPSDVVFAGYGLVAPADGALAAYDSYEGLDVKDKWVVVFRYVPEKVTPEVRQHLARFSPLRFKAMAARDKGARGIIYVSGPNSAVKDELVGLGFDAALAGSSVAAVSMTNAAAEKLLAPTGKTLKALQDALDAGTPVKGAALAGTKVHAHVDLQQQKATGRNVLARLRVGAQDSAELVIVGAHVDHLGRGHTNSLAREEEKGGIHRGADDNASGVAGLLEIAQALAAQKAAGKAPLKRDVLFAAWSGEELGLLGSAAFVRTFGGAKEEPKTLRPTVWAYLNMDMIGRMDKALVMQGVGSSSVWSGEIERRNVPLGLSITPQNDSHLPTDATSFYLKGVPILAAFTGAHSEYHTPRDTADRINLPATEKIVRLMLAITGSMATRAEAPDYKEMAAPAAAKRGAMRVTLGTIPDYAQEGVKGLKVGGAVKGGPAEKAGLQAGDIIVELGGKKVENIYDFMFVLENLKANEPVAMVVERAGAKVKMQVTPAPRE